MAAAAKTIVITLPRHLKPRGAPLMVSPTPSQLSTPLLAGGNYLHVIKDEPEDSRAADGDTKPPRKRQRLDHLTQEEKIMRRKLKNRVAAQTARDRKKVRMDQLEAQLADMTEHISELTNLTSILSDQNAELTEENTDLQEKLAACTCSSRTTENSQEAAEVVIGDQSQRGRATEGTVVPVTVPTDGSAAGSRHLGSYQDHGALYTLLPVGGAGGSNSDRRLCGVAPDRRQQQLSPARTAPAQTPPPSSSCPAGEEENNWRQVVGAAATVLEPSWDIVDHDYYTTTTTITGNHTQQESNERLTPAEEDLITQLTSALEDVPQTSPSVRDVSGEGVTISIDDTVDVATPDIVRDFFDFGMDNITLKEEGDINMSPVRSKDENTHSTCASASPRDVLPISKEQILDYLQEHQQKVSTSPNRSLFDSESGYESGSSPRSFGLDECDDQNIDFDMHSFSELFPSLF